MQTAELINNCKFLVDFGMMLLIWLVQLIIYPSFLYVDKLRFKPWHFRYTGLITILVAPLMFGQLIIYCILLLMVGGWNLLLNLVLIAVAWLATMLLSVPCHDLMQKNGYDRAVILRLIRTNWIRTVAWSVVFLSDAVVLVGQRPLT